MKGLSVTPDLLRAYAEGRKTVTRRLSGLNKINQEPGAWELKGRDLFWSWLDKMAFIFQKTDGQELIIKPPFQVGEVVYLKEAWETDPSNSNIVYKSDIGAENTKTFIFGGYRWRSPHSMPAWAARYFQRIVSVRPEQLWAITPEDCLAEGLILQPFDTCDLCLKGVCSRHQPVLGKFHNLWDSLYPKYPWAISPWVWRIQSERAERP